MSKTTSGIKSFGAYIPRRRIARTAIAAAHDWSVPALKAFSRGERSLCNWDEDVITMAVEAGRDCLRGVATDSIAGLTLASTTAPYADLNNAVLVGAALRLAPQAAAADAGGSIRAGLSALIKACRGSENAQLVIASEHRTGKPGSVQEIQFGCGAGGLLVGQGDDVIAEFLGAETLSVPFINSFRAAGESFDYGWEERWVRDEGVAKFVPAAVTRLLDRLGLGVNDIACFGLSGGPLGSDKLVAKALRLAPERVLPDLQASVGDTGAAHPLLLVVEALERAQPGDVIVIASFAQGCEVIALRMREASARPGRRGLAGSIAQRIEETSYVKLLSFDGHLEIDWGMRAETDAKTALTQLYRVADQIFGFTGGKCRGCGSVQFPRLPACVNCGAIDSQQPYCLVDEPAQVATWTADYLMATPAPPIYVGLVQFDAGARVLMELVDVVRDGIDVGTALAMTFRIKERDRERHFDRYFWKATPFLGATS